MSCPVDVFVHTSHPLLNIGCEIHKLKQEINDVFKFEKGGSS